MIPPLFAVRKRKRRLLLLTVACDFRKNYIFSVITLLSFFFFYKIIFFINSVPVELMNTVRPSLRQINATFNINMPQKFANFPASTYFLWSLRKKKLPSFLPRFSRCLCESGIISLSLPFSFPFANVYVAPTYAR